MRTIEIWGFGASYIRDFTVIRVRVMLIRTPLELIRDRMAHGGLAQITEGQFFSYKAQICIFINGPIHRIKWHPDLQLIIRTNKPCALSRMYPYETAACLIGRPWYSTDIFIIKCYRTDNKLLPETIVTQSSYAYLPRPHFINIVWFKSRHGYVITFIIMCGMKLLTHSQTSTIVKFGNG